MFQPTPRLRDSYLNRGLFTLLGLFVLFFVLLTLVQRETHRAQLREAIALKHAIIQDMVMTATRHPMRKRIDTFLRVNRDVIVDAYRRHDRRALLEDPRLRRLMAQFPQEYPGFALLQFHDARGRSFVRMHAPEHFGDDLSRMRAMIPEVRRTLRKITAYEVDKYGLYYRVAVPVQDDDGSLLGVLEFGLDQRWITRTLEPLLIGDHPTVLLREANATIHEDLPGFGAYRLRHAGSDPFIQAIPYRLPEGPGLHERFFQGRHYVFETADAPTLRDYQDRPVAKIVVFHDVTQLKERFAEAVTRGFYISFLLFMITFYLGYQLFRRLFARIEDSEQRYRDLLEHLPAGVAVHAKGRILLINSTFAKMLGGSADSIVGKRVLDFIVPESRDLVAPRLQTRYHERSSPTVEHQVRRLDGGTFWAQVTTVTIEFDAHTAVFSIIFDVTERRRIEGELAELNEQLEMRVIEEVERNRRQEQMLMQQSRLAAMGEMIGAIAHQWRQPLAALGAILINIQDSFEFGRLDAPMLDAKVHEAEAQLEHMSTTIDDFRNFFRPDRQKEPFDLIEAIHASLSLSDAQFKNHHIALQLEVCHAQRCEQLLPDDALPPGEPLQVVGFPGEFKQVILNLLTNARDTIVQSGRMDGSVFIRISEGETHHRVRVLDNGGGIPETVIARVFDPYFTTKGEGKGTGLGLYMSKMIVETGMGGSLDVENGDHGASFTITLPRHHPQATQ